MNLFDIVNEDLFKPLTWGDRRRYIDVLLLIWNRCRRRPMYSMGKTEVTDLVEAYLSGFDGDISVGKDEEEGTPEGTGARSVATFMLRHLKSKGWLLEKDGDYNEEGLYALDHHIIPVLRAFENVIDPKAVTYKGRLFEVYSLLSHIDEVDSPYESCLKVAEESLVDLNLSLHQLDASIEEHINILIEGKKPEDILDFFDKYEEDIVVGAYQRFKTNDNLFYYRNSLSERLELCESELMERLIKDYILSERSTEAEARYRITEIIRSMRNALDEMEDMIKAIDDHHILYRTRAVQRAQFLMMTDSSTKGKIAGLLKYYSHTIRDKEDIVSVDDTPITGAFQIFGQNYFDFYSLTMPSKRKKPTPINDMTEIEELDQEYIDAQNRALIEYVKNALTAENVNRYAVEVLKDRYTVSVKTLLEEDPTDIIKIIGLYTYSRSQDRVYNVNEKENEITAAGIRFKEFFIERK